MKYETPDYIRRDIAISTCRALIKFLIQGDPSLETECEQMLIEPDDSVSFQSSPFDMVVIEGMHSVGQKLVVALLREGVDTLSAAGVQHAIDHAKLKHSAMPTASTKEMQKDNEEQGADFGTQ